MFNPKSTLTLLFTFLATWVASAQLTNEEVEVFKTFDAQLAEAEKLEIPALLPPLDTAVSFQEYDIQEVPFEIQYLPPRIRPIALQREKMPDAYNGLIRIGGGSPRALLTEGSYFLNTERLNLGLDLRHYSFKNDRQIESQRMATNRFGLRGAYHFDQGFSVGGNFGYDLDYRYFYGYNNFPTTADTLLSFNLNEVRQQFSTFHGGFTFTNNAPTVGDIDYKAALDYYFMQDNYGTRENGALIELEGTKWFNEKNPLTFKLSTDLVGYEDTARQSPSIFHLNGSYTYHSPTFLVKAGLTIGTSQNRFSIFPDVEVAVKVWGNYITALAGGDGGFKKNSFRTLTDYSPFLESRVRLQNSRYYRVFAGIQGEFFGINYRLQGEWKPTEALPLFETVHDTIPRFNVVYDTGSVTSIIAELGFAFSEDLTVKGTVTQNFFSLDTNEKPWHLPSFLVNAEARYATFEGKVELVAGFFVQNGVPVQNIEGETENLGALFDVSVGGEFLFSKNFGMFLQLNNLTNNKRERWQYYPSIGFNVLAGLSARF